MDKLCTHALHLAVIYQEKSDLRDAFDHCWIEVPTISACDLGGGGEPVAAATVFGV